MYYDHDEIKNLLGRYDIGILDFDDLLLDMALLMKRGNFRKGAKAMEAARKEYMSMMAEIDRYVSGEYMER